MSLFAFTVAVHLAYMEPPCGPYDLDSFPSTACCQHNIEFSHAHEQWLDNMAWVYPEKAEWITQIKLGMEQRRKAWELIREAKYIVDPKYNGHNEYIPLKGYWRDQVCFKLSEVRKLIGPDYYHARALPDIIDLSYFVKD